MRSLILSLELYLHSSTVLTCIEEASPKRKINWKKDPRLHPMRVFFEGMKKKVTEDLQEQLQPQNPIEEETLEQLSSDVKAEKTMRDLKEQLIARKGRRKDWGDGK